jgi:hypothetical protein
MTHRPTYKKVVVVGMHRSGTSAVTRVVNLLGLPVGRSEDLMSGPDNERGHWESSILSICNDLVLSEFHGTFSRPPVLRKGWERSRNADLLIPRLRTAFLDIYRTDRWVWKDPRLALILPIWRRILSDFCVVLVVRNPSAVTASLNRRDGFPLAYCHALWEKYNRSALAAVSGLPVLVVNFDDILEDRKSGVIRIASGLDALGVEMGGDVEAAAESVRADKQQERASRPKLNDSMTLELWNRLQGMPTVSHEFRRPDLGSDPMWVDIAIRAAKIWSSIEERTGFRYGHA